MSRAASAPVVPTGLGLGAAQLGNMYRRTTDEEAAATVRTAWEAGVRLVDTAPHYGLGLSERRLGAALAGLPRDQVAVSTKVGRLLEPSPATAHLDDPEGFLVPAALRRRWDFTRDGVLRSVEASLERLGLDRLDVVHLHDPDDHLEEAATSGARALVELRDQGVVGAVGAGMNDAGRLAELVRRCDLDVVMVAGRWTLLDQSALDELLPLALERDVAVVAAGVFNSGLLGAPAVPDDARYDYAPAPAALRARTRTLAEACERHGTTLPAAAVRFPLRHPAVRAVVVGAHTPEQVAENVARYREPVPDALWEELVERGLVR